VSTGLTPAAVLRAAAGRLRGWAAAAPGERWAPGAVAAFGPQLADWLEFFAQTEFDPEADIQVTDRSHEKALAVARAVLAV
jgi:hypothetical protein